MGRITIGAITAAAAPAVVFWMIPFFELTFHYLSNSDRNLSDPPSLAVIEDNRGEAHSSRDLLEEFLPQLARAHTTR